jgi:transposase
MKFFELTKTDYDKLVEECMLDEEYQKLLEYKIKGYSRVKIATKLNVTEFTVDKMIQKLKKKITKML